MKKKIITAVGILSLSLLFSTAMPLSGAQAAVSGTDAASQPIAENESGSSEESVSDESGSSEESVSDESGSSEKSVSDESGSSEESVSDESRMSDVSAADESTASDISATDETDTDDSESNAFVADNAGLLSEEEKQSLSEKLQEVSEAHNCSVVVVTTDSTGGESAQDYADDYYDSHDYGYGSDRTGILLLLDMGERQWAISTTGDAIEVFTDAGQEYLTDQIVSYFSDGEYYDGFTEYADLCEQYLIQAEEGEPYDTGNLPGDEEMPAGRKWAILIVVSAVIGLGVALIRVLIMRSRLKSVSIAKTAGNYVKGGEVNLTDQRDVFLYHTVSRVPKPKNNDNGGSSTHMGSSGTTHGGSSGSF